MLTVVDQAVVTQVEDQLRQTTGLLRKQERQILGRFDVTPPQFDALLVLKEFGALTMGELCEKIFLANSTATDLVDRMERYGLIERVRDTTDRRAIRLRVLPKGEQVTAEALAARQRHLAKILYGVPLEDKERLIVSLEHLQHHLVRGPAQ